MACFTEWKHETSPISSAHVSAVIGPTPGTVLRFSSRSFDKRISFQRTDQSIIGLLQSFDGFAAELEQWPDAFIHFWVRGEQLSEILHLVQSLFVVGHSSLE